jgi:lauroyl/myristoyl acyltransferase
MVTIVLLSILFYYFYITYTLRIIYGISYILAYIPYYLNIRKNIIEINLKLVFPTITKIRQDHIRFHSWKFLIINTITCLNQYLLKNSYLLNYYTIHSISLPKKSFITLAHFGLYYDFISFFKLTQNIFYGIYKSKIFNLNFNTKIKTVKHDRINTQEINKYHTLYTPIDQKSLGKSQGKTETILFLNNNITFQSFLIELSLRYNRDIYFYYVIIDRYKLYPKLIKIETRDKSIYDIVQTIANEMTTIIKKYPEQYLWSYKRFNVTY